MNEYHIVPVGVIDIYIDKVNGNSIMIRQDETIEDFRDLFCIKPATLNKTNTIEETNNNKDETPVFISIHSSNSCNLNCRYCFRDYNHSENLTFDESCKFIDLVIERHQDASKYIVDLTGSGEPLLNLDLIYKINDYCKLLSNKLFREFTVIIATNGTLLTKEIVDELQNRGIIFGVSLDSRNKKNSFRVDLNNKSVHKKVIQNVNKIKERGFLGVAYTLTGQVDNLKKDMIYLNKLFPTISVKPVRSNDDHIRISTRNVDNIIIQYTDLYNHLLKQCYQGNFTTIIALLDGDDYFGKLLNRVLSNQRINLRCDAGLYRYSLSNDKNIYVCPAAVGINNLTIGDIYNGFHDEKLKLTKKALHICSENDTCTNCFARFYCGGICMVNSYTVHKTLIDNDLPLCTYTKHLLKLAFSFVYYIKNHSENYYNFLRDFCTKKTMRNQTDKDLVMVAKKYREDYSFTEIMRMHFEERALFNELLSKIK